MVSNIFLTLLNINVYWTTFYLISAFLTFRFNDNMHYGHFLLDTLKPHFYYMSTGLRGHFHMEIFS